MHYMYPLNVLPGVRQVRLCMSFKTVIYLLDCIFNFKYISKFNIEKLNAVSL